MYLVNTTSSIELTPAILQQYTITMAFQGMLLMLRM